MIRWIRAADRLSSERTDAREWDAQGNGFWSRRRTWCNAAPCIAETDPWLHWPRHVKLQPLARLNCPGDHLGTFGRPSCHAVPSHRSTLRRDTLLSRLQSRTTRRPLLF